MRKARGGALREGRGEVEESWAKYAELYDYAPVGHLTVDAFGTIRQLNLTCAALLDRERRLLEGLPLRGLLDPASHPDLEAHLRAVASSRAPTTVELLVLLPDGQQRPVDLVTAPRSPPQGDAAQVLYHSALIDVSERKRAEGQREDLLRRERDARLLAESANQVKEDFLAIVAHELRTPLAPFLLWLKALRLRGADAALRARALDAIQEGLKAHLAMIDDLVDVARGRHDSLRVERRPLDLRPVVTGAVEALAPSAAAKMIAVEVSVPIEPVTVSGDGIRLRQVVSNLLSNAVKFTSEGGRVSVAVRLDDGQAELVVSDDGEGLEPALLEEVFEPFRQRDDTVRGRGGLGLGLTIVRQLVEEHGGTVRAESAGRGQGASFTVKLPSIAAEGATGAPAAEAGGFPVLESNVLQGLRVLVVEDQSDTRDALAFVLEASGAQVLAVRSTAEAWAVVCTAPRPDVVVSDIGLPGEDGNAFMRRLRMRESDAGDRRVPAIALTARSAPRDRAKALLSGFDRHVGKPIAFDELVATISSLLRSPAMRRLDPDR